MRLITDVILQELAKGAPVESSWQAALRIHKREHGGSYEDADLTCDLREALSILRRAQKRYPGGDDLVDERAVEEIRDALRAAGLLNSDHLETELFHEILAKSPRAVRMNCVSIPKEYLCLYKKRKRTEETSEIIKSLRRIAASPKPPWALKSCRGMVKLRVNLALRSFEGRWLRQIGIDASNVTDVLGALKRHELSQDDLLRIRSLISKRLIPQLANSIRHENAAKPWKNTVVLELADLYARYAGFAEVTQIAAGSDSLFAKFVGAAIRPFVKKDADYDIESLSKVWVSMKRTMCRASDAPDTCSH